MALRFQPYNINVDNNNDRTRFQQTVLDPIGQGLGLIAQNQEYKRQLERQRMLDEYAQQDRALKIQQMQQMYGTPIDSNIQSVSPYAQSRPVQSSIFPGQQIQAAQPSPLIERFNQWRAQGMSPKTAEPDFMPALGQEAQQQYQQQFQTKDLSPYQIESLNLQKQRLADVRRTGGETSVKLRQEFINRPEVKTYQQISRQVSTMDSLLNKALAGDFNNKVALDQALISTFNKLTDPNSVVRESEYARTPENLPFINKVSGSIQKLQSGGAGLTDDDRKALVLGAKIIANEMGNQYQSQYNEYTNLSNKLGLDPSVVTGTMAPFKPYGLRLQSYPQNQQIREFNTLQEAEAANLPPGTKIRIGGRSATVQ